MDDVEVSSRRDSRTADHGCSSDVVTVEVWV